MGTKALQYIFHHVVFPPKLPLEPEGGQNSLDRELLLFVKAVLDSFVSQRAEDVQNKWKPVLNMVDTWLAVDPAGTLNRHQEALAFALLNLKTHGTFCSHLSDTVLTDDVIRSSSASYQRPELWMVGIL
jgi:hypothetical protein